MKPATISTPDGIYVLDHDGFYVAYEEPDPKLPAWQNSALWYGGFALGLGTLFLAGEGMWMALEALHG